MNSNFSRALRRQDSRRSNAFFVGSRRPYRQAASDPVTQHLCAEILFVLPLDLGHGEQTIDELVASATGRILGRMFILDNIAAFEFTRAVHGEQPSRNVTEHLKRSSDDAGANLSRRIGQSAESGKHFSDEASMMPFLIFDLVDMSTFLGIRNGMPVPAIGIRCRSLTGIGKLKDLDQLNVVGHR